MCLGNAVAACVMEHESGSLQLVLTHCAGRRLVQALPRPFGPLKLERKPTENSREKKRLWTFISLSTAASAWVPCKPPCGRAPDNTHVSSRTQGRLRDSHGPRPAYFVGLWLAHIATFLPRR